MDRRCSCRDDNPEFGGRISASDNDSDGDDDGDGNGSGRGSG